ncbi:DMT family transporter [Bifidobacterium aquikefiri]|uniref:DMT family transporter n=1 Tax=Bifidobacterium aquikefiri TaxID=1653207 RepID=UPI0023F3821B|nr:DMT family transporter [Bifidobacterium aquikefiri]
MFSLLIGLVIGFGLPVQTAINSRLRNIVDSPMRSSMISFSIGTIFLALVLLITMQGLIVPIATFAQQPWWIWIGGILGVVYLTGNIVLFPHLGAAQTVIMPVVGQLIMSMLIDNFGWFGLPRHTLTLVRVVGGIVVLFGVVLVVFTNSSAGTLKTAETRHASLVLPWQIAGICTGMLSAAQTAINGHLGTVLQSPEKAAFISFLVGTVALLLIVAIYEHGIHIRPAFSTHNPWWIWLGGVIGSLFVLGNAYLVPEIGTGLTVVIVLFGMIAGGLVIDSLGWLGARRIKVKAIQLVGILILVCGVVLIKLF